MESQTDPRFAPVTGLGQFKKLYEGPKLERWVNVIAIIALALFLLVSAVFMYGGYPQSLKCLWLVPIGMLLLIPLTLQTFWAVALYEGGVACHDPWHGLRQIHWDEISHLYETWAAEGNEYSWDLTRRFRVGIEGGRKIRLPGHLDDLWATIIRNVLPRLVQEASAAIRAGATLRFGPFQVSAQGLGLTRRLDNRFVEWRNVRSIDEPPDASIPYLSKIAVTLQRDVPSNALVWPQPRRDAIHEPALFLALCRHFIRESSGVRGACPADPGH